MFAGEHAGQQAAAQRPGRSGAAVQEGSGAGRVHLHSFSGHHHPNCATHPQAPLQYLAVDRIRRACSEVIERHVTQPSGELKPPRAGLRVMGGGGGRAWMDAGGVLGAQAGV